MAISQLYPKSLYRFTAINPKRKNKSKDSGATDFTYCSSQLNLQHYKAESSQQVNVSNIRKIKHWLW